MTDMQRKIFENEPDTSIADEHIAVYTSCCGFNVTLKYFISFG